MAIIVRGGEPLARAMVATAVAQARREAPGLGESGRDVLIVTDDCSGYAPSSRRPDTGLVVMTKRPSAVQAAVALLLGADAYLPLDHDPVQTAAALARVARGGLHIEPETAAALHSLVALTKGMLPHPHQDETCLALRLRSRGWAWNAAVASVGIDRDMTAEWLRQLLERVRPAR